MDKKRRRLSKNDDCRLCSATEAEDYQDAITENVIVGSSRILLSDLILQVLQIQIKLDDGYSSQICGDCSRTIVQFYGFKRKCKRVQEKLKSVLNPEPDLVDQAYEIVLNYFQKYSVTTMDVQEHNHQLIISRSFPDPMAGTSEAWLPLPNIKSEPGLDITEPNVILFEVKSEIVDPEYSDQEDQSESNDPNWDGNSSQSSEDDIKVHFRTKVETIIEEPLSPAEPLDPTAELMENLVCPKCNKLFTKKVYLRKHCKMCCPEVIQKKGIVCDVCKKATVCMDEKTFQRNHRKLCLKAQKRKEMGLGGKRSRNPTCDFCPKVFHSDKIVLYGSHMDMHTAFKYLLEKQLVTFFECHQCLRVLKTEEELYLHLAIHSDGGPSETDNIGCEYCKAEYPTPELAKEHHYFRHQTHFVCPIETCRMEHKHYGRFYFHLQTSHPNFINVIPEFNCYYCQEKFSSYLDLQRHRHHLGNCAGKIYKCGSHCDKKFGTEKLLNTHLRQVANPVYCEECGKSFLDTTQLKIHQQLHVVNKSGERNFKCTLCDEYFPTSVGRARHIKSHTTDRIFGCDLCDYKGTSSKNVTKHKHSRHSDKVICPMCDLVLNSKKSVYQHLRGVHQLSVEELAKIKPSLQVVKDP